VSKLSFKVAIDIDDTIGDLLGAWVAYLNTKYSLDIKVENIVEWDMRKAFPMLSKEEIYEPITQEDFWKNIEPKKDAAKYISKMITDGCEVYLCTSTDYRNIYPKFKFFVQPNFPFINWHQVMVMHNKQLANVDVMIDDGFHNLIGGDYIKVLVDMPHNRYFQVVGEEIYRAHNWREIYDLVSFFFKHSKERRIYG